MTKQFLIAEHTEMRCKSAEYVTKNWYMGIAQQIEIMRCKSAEYVTKNDT